MSNRICALCKLSRPNNEMIKLGKDRMCRDRRACYERKLGWPETESTNTNLKSSEKLECSSKNDATVDL